MKKKLAVLAAVLMVSAVLGVHRKHRKPRHRHRRRRKRRLKRKPKRLQPKRERLIRERHCRKEKYAAT